MALEGLHVPALSSSHLNLCAKALTVDFAAPCYVSRSLAFGEGRFQCLHCIHSRGASVSLNIKRKWFQCLHCIHSRGASVSLNIKRKWKHKPLVIKCRRNNGSSDKSETPQRDGPFRRSGLGRTRLARIVQAVQNKIAKKIKGLQQNFPMKVLCLLLGFYCAGLVATSLAQTGDWDILSAGLAVAIIEAIGALMYRAYPLIERLRSFVVMVNYWKAGLSLGLFLDAFKYEMDINSMLCDLSRLEINLFSVLWW